MSFKNIFKISDEKKTKIIAALVRHYFNFKKHFFYSKNINYPNTQCIFALWHAHQCGLYSLNNRDKLSVMISRSRDGEIIATATESLGIKTVRGSQSRGGASAALQMIDRIKEGENAAITIDGPRGPKRIVKKGVVEIAKISGVPIVPMTWYSPSWGFLKFKTWDEFRFPLNCIKMIALFGDPIHVPSDAADEDIEVFRKQIEDELNALYARAKKDFKKLRRG